MKGLFRGWIIFSLSALLVSVAFTFYFRHAQAQGITPPPPSADNAIREAVQNAVIQNQQNVLGFMINNVEVSEIFYSKDGRTALVMLAQRDLETGDILGREPGYAVALNSSGVLAQADSWHVDFQTENDLPGLLTSLPPELLNDELRQEFASIQTSAGATAQTFSGYKLPWSSALRIKLTGSVGHFLGYNSCAEVSCRYAYDFWNPDAGNRMFPLLASKGGIMRAKRDSCTNHDPNCTNYFVLEDNSTSPTTYQLYYHIANGSIQPALQIGSYIQQGQYVANVDDTGASTDSHLHFMVYQTPTAANYFWGNSVRIFFSDVPYNGGEPRTCAETTMYSGYGTQCSLGPDGAKGTGDDDYLTSGNVGTESPTGSLDVPFPWTTLTARTFTISGKASDRLGISRVDILLKKGATWSTIGTADFNNGVYVKTVDLCAAQIPDGPFGLAVRIWDIAGNWAGQYTGLRQLVKNVPCGANTPPILACAPSADEVALYSEANFAGTCKKFLHGRYNTLALAPLGDNNTSSIQVGANVHAVLFDKNDDLNLNKPLGRLETFTTQDANLADNRLGAKETSALWVENASEMTDASPLEPFLTFPGSRVDGDNDSTSVNPPNPKSSDSLVLAWTGGKGATLFTSNIVVKGTTTVVKTMSARYTQTWDVGSLPAGVYTWTVTGCIGTTTCSGMVSNSTSLDFTVDPGTLGTSGQIDAPTPTWDMQGGPGNWVATGLWRWGDVDRYEPDSSRKPTKAWIFNNGTSYSDSTYRAGDLTSPPIRVSANGTYYLHFRFFSNTEGALYDNQTYAAPFWDQRSVQVSVNNGPFSSLSSVPSVAPLSEDTQNTGSYWPDGPILPLGNLTTGQILRVRFHFDSVDIKYNNFAGWAIDDVRMDKSGPEGSCNSLSNDTAASATPIELDGPPSDSTICPQGDIDYYSFTGTGGTPVRIKIDAKSIDKTDPLDSFISLIDSSGRDVIAANDDSLPASDPRFTQDQYRDSLIETILPRNGTYYVRVRSSWDFPGSGGLAYIYKLSVTTNTASIPRPVIDRITKPTDAQHLAQIPFIVEVNAADPNGSGVKKVDFFWHTNDWINSAWVLFASDTNGSDGWWSIFNPPADLTGGAFYMMATNNMGGTGGALMTDVAPDLNTPVSSLNGLPAQTNSTAVQLTWNASDPLNLIDHFIVQYAFNGGAWAEWPTQPAGWQRAAWFVGQPGPYLFRIAAINQSGNKESFTSGAEASTILASACTNDPYEANNSRNSATVLASNKVIQMVLCQNDIDWVSFQAVQGQEYALMFPSQGGGSEMHVRVFDPSGVNIVAEGQSSQPGQSLVMRWTAPASGLYTLEISSNDPAVYGTDVRYGVYAGPPHWIFLPTLHR